MLLKKKKTREKNESVPQGFKYTRTTRKGGKKRKESACKNDGFKLFRILRLFVFVFVFFFFALFELRSERKKMFVVKRRGRDNFCDAARRSFDFKAYLKRESSVFYACV